MRGYKAFFLVVFSSLLLSVPLRSSGEEIPELYDWWSIEADTNTGWYFAQYFAYVPNFDTANRGVNAVAVYTRTTVEDDSSSTWYNRYFMDTLNQFNWYGGSERVLTSADLNGDGVLDYLTWQGRVYKGTTPYAPPEKLERGLYNFASVSIGERRIVMDVNNDGYEDVLCPKSNIGGNNLFTILFGGEDLSKLMSVRVKKRPEHGYGEYFLGAFQKGEGDTTVKIVNLSYEYMTIDGNQYKKWYALVLREMSVKNVGDTVDISFRTLDSLWFDGYKTDKPSWEMTYGSSKIFTNKKAGKEYLIARSILWTPGKDRRWYAMLYEMADGELHEVQSFASIDPFSSNVTLLGGDVNGDGYDDWGILGRNNDFYIYRGLRDGIDSVPIAMYRLDSQRFPESAYTTILAIGDVTGDGVGDMAIGYDVPNGKFSIIKGEKLHPVGVEEPVAGYAPADFSMEQSYPNPIGAERNAMLPVQLRRAGQYSVLLYSLQGRQIAELYNGFLPAGTSQLPLQLSRYGLSAGFYVLRLGDGVLHTERGILLR